MNFERLDGDSFGEMNSKMFVAGDHPRAFPKHHHGIMRHASVGILKRGPGNLRLGQKAIDLMAERFESCNYRLYGANGDVWFQVSHSCLRIIHLIKKSS